MNDTIRQVFALLFVPHGLCSYNFVLLAGSDRAVICAASAILYGYVFGGGFLLWVWLKVISGAAISLSALWCMYGASPISDPACDDRGCAPCCRFLNALLHLIWSGTPPYAQWASASAPNTWRYSRAIRMMNLMMHSSTCHVHDSSSGCAWRLLQAGFGYMMAVRCRLQYGDLAAGDVRGCVP
jgi:hypothetical protein